MRVIDAHVHVWSQDVLRYPFGPHNGVPAPTDARTLDGYLADAGDQVREMLLIQPRVYGYDHAYLFAAAAALPGRVRVMPLVNVAREGSAGSLRRLAAHPHTAGVRVIALDEAPADWLCSAEAHQAWRIAAQLDLPVGLLVSPQQLVQVARVADAHPDLRLVVDHMGRCTPALQARFGAQLCDLAKHPNVYVKLSAVHALSAAPYPYDDMRPLIVSLYQAFGASRMLWGSDWPHLRQADGHGRCRAAVEAALSSAPAVDRAAIFGTTAARLLGFGSAETMGGTDGHT